MLPKGITKEMVLSVVSSPYVSGKDPITILPVADKFYALLPCRFEVLVWRGEEWENLCKVGFAAKVHTEENADDLDGAFLRVIFV